MQNSFQLYRARQQQDFELTERDEWWWPDSESFAVIIGALLTQQSRWGKVEESLANLRNADLFSPKAITSSSVDEIIPLI